MDPFPKWESVYRAFLTASQQFEIRRSKCLSVQHDQKLCFVKICQLHRKVCWASSDWSWNKRCIKLGKRGQFGSWGENHHFPTNLMGYLLYFQDLLISGNVDEVLSRRALHQLKWCEVKEDVITGAKKSLWKKRMSNEYFPCTISCNRTKSAQQFFGHSKIRFLKGALWMPMGNLGRAFRTGSPVHKRPHTLSVPTIYKVSV